MGKTDAFLSIIPPVKDPKRLALSAMLGLGTMELETKKKVVRGNFALVDS